MLFKEITFISHFNIVALMPKIYVCNDSKDLMITTVVNIMVKPGIVITS